VRSAIADAQPNVRVPRHSLRGARMCMAFYISTMTHPGAVQVWRTLCRRGNPGIRRGTTNTAAFTPSRALPQSGISRLAAATTRSAKLLPEPRRPARPPAHPATTRAACCDPCAPVRPVYTLESEGRLALRATVTCGAGKTSALEVRSAPAHQRPGGEQGAAQRDTLSVSPEMTSKPYLKRRSLNTSA